MVASPSSFNDFCDVCQALSCPPNMISAPSNSEDEVSDTTRLLCRSVATSSEMLATTLNVQAELPSSSMISRSANLSKSKLTIPGSSAEVIRSVKVFEALFDAFPLCQEVEKGFSEYDYSTQASKFSELDDISAFVLKDTFIDIDTCQSSPNSFYEAHHIESCLAGGARKPYGLEEGIHETGKMQCWAVSTNSFTTATTIGAAGMDAMQKKELSNYKEALVLPGTGAHRHMNTPPPPPEPPARVPISDFSVGLEQIPE